MEIYYKPPFRKFVKKQTRSFQTVIEDEVEIIIQDPESGELNNGDLSGFRVRKFTFKKQLYLIAYSFIEVEILFYQIGTHENFYRQLKRYLRG